MEKSDRELLEAISMKDHDAFSELYNRYSRIVFRQIVSRLSDKDAAEDVLQDYWLYIWSHPDKVRTETDGNAKISLQYLLSKRILDYYRRVCSKIVLKEEIEYTSTDTPYLEYTHVFEDLLKKELIDMIDQLVETLPELDKQVYNMRIKASYSVEETANKLSISKKTVINKTSLITAAIRSELTIVVLGVILNSRL